MRLLYLSTVFPRPDDQTHGIFSYHLCSALAAQHEVRVVSPRSWLEWVRTRGGKAVRDGDSSNDRRQLRAIYPRYYYPPRMLRNAHGWFMWHSVQRRLRALLQTYRPECILSYWSYPDGAVANRAARVAKVPSVVMVGGSDVLLCDRVGRRERVSTVLRSASAVVTIGRDLRDKVVAMGVQPDRVFVTERGVDTQNFCRGDRQEARKRLGIPLELPALLWVGRMAPVKGLSVLLEACAQLRASGQRFRLYLVGDGELRSSMEKAALAANLLTPAGADSERSAGVSFVGIRAHHQLPDWYRAADVTVLPSLSEGVPNVLRESLACGTPFVASRVGGIPEISTDPANRLVAPGEPTVLAEAIALALHERPATKLETVPVVDWNQAAQSLLEVIRRL